MDPLTVWNDCVEAAKVRHGVTGYQMLKGKVLKDAQVSYCAIMVGR